MRTVRWGVLSTASIATEKVIPGLGRADRSEVLAIASRDGERARATAGRLGIPRAYGSYEALLADPDVDAVYIPLPNHLHAEWTAAAARAGKHVLCEKPLAMTADEARAMFAAARTHGVLLREAYPYMAQPQTLRLRELLREGVVGRVRSLSATMGFRIVTPEGEPLCDPANIRLQPERGGGALLDAGTYAMSLVRIAAGERPVRAFAAARWAKSGVDQTVAATLEFASGTIAQISCSMSGAFHRKALIVGEKGAIETSYSNHAPAGGTLPLSVKRGIPGVIPFEVETLPAADGFRLEAESFARMVRGGAQHWTGATEAESIDIAMALEAIAESARAGHWVPVG